MTLPRREQDAAEYRQNLLRYPSEQPDVDYKAAVPFQKRQPFGVKLIKHILAFANGGGGTIVIGFREGEDKRHYPDEAMTPDLANSYDPTMLIPAVNEAIRGHEGITLRIYKESWEGVVYPMIVVDSFVTVPFFCAVDRQDERDKPLLKAGALYIRSNEASSVELATPDDWLRLLEVAVARRQDDLLTRFGALMRQFGLAPQEVGGATLEQLKLEFQAWIDHQKTEAHRLAREGERELPGSYMFAYRPVKLLEPLIDTDLLAAAQTARRPNTGWPMGLIPYNFRNTHDRYEPVAEGLRIVIGQHENDHFDYWLLGRTGEFFLFRNLQDDVRYWGAPVTPGTSLTASTVVWRVAEALDHCIALYRALKLGGEAQVLFEAEYDGLMGRTLIDERGTLFHAGPAARSTVRFSRMASLDQLVADADGIVLDAVRTILSVFNFFEVPPTYVTRELQDYRNSNVRG